MKERTASFTKKYRFGFNNQEQETELGGYSAISEFWIYDPRNCRRFNLDPVTKSEYSGFAVLGGNPIIFIDRKGDDWFIYYEEEGWFIFKKKVNVQLIWKHASSVLDVDGHHWCNVGKTLELEDFDKYMEIKTGGPNRLHNTLPLDIYILTLDNLGDPVKDLGYDNFGEVFNCSQIGGLHAKVKYDYGTNMEGKLFKANDNINVNNYFTFMMHAFIFGDGEENFLFDESHSVSQSMLTSTVVKDAVKMYEEGEGENADKLRSGGWVGIKTSLLEDLIPMSVRGINEHGTPLSPEHFTGSCEIRMSLSAGGDFYYMDIWNTTSLGSGTLNLPRLPRPEDTGTDQPFTNISQTFRLKVPVKND